MARPAYSSVDIVRPVQERDFDVVVFGSTGVTGRQVSAYLAEQGARWAAAARAAGKCEQVLGEIGVSAPETIVADVSEPSSLAAMAARARVVLNLVGPYTRYGRPGIQVERGDLGEGELDLASRRSPPFPSARTVRPPAPGRRDGEGPGVRT